MSSKMLEKNETSHYLGMFSGKYPPLDRDDMRVLIEMAYHHAFGTQGTSEMKVLWGRFHNSANVGIMTITDLQIIWRE